MSRAVLRRVALATIIASLLIACGKEQPATGPKQAPSLPTIVVAQAGGSRDRLFDGRVEGIEQTAVRAQTAGRVATVVRDVNDTVTAGALVLRLRGVEQRAVAAVALAVGGQQVLLERHAAVLRHELIALDGGITEERKREVALPRPEERDRSTPAGSQVLKRPRALFDPHREKRRIKGHLRNPVDGSRSHVLAVNGEDVQAIGDQAESGLLGISVHVVAPLDASHAHLNRCTVPRWRVFRGLEGNPDAYVPRILSAGCKEATTMGLSVLRASAIVIVGAIVANAVLYFLAKSVIDLDPGFAPLGSPVQPALFTLVGTGLACAAYAWMRSRGGDYNHRFTLVAIAALIVSFLPDIGLLASGMPGATPASITVLMLMHVVAAAIAIKVLTATSTT